jgi:hypothetical protein
MLRPRRDYKRQPMRRDGSMQKRDGETRNNKSDENDLIHL